MRVLLFSVGSTHWSFNTVPTSQRPEALLCGSEGVPEPHHRALSISKALGCRWPIPDQGGRGHTAAQRTGAHPSSLDNLVPKGRREKTVAQRLIQRGTSKEAPGSWMLSEHGPAPMGATQINKGSLLGFLPSSLERSPKEQLILPSTAWGRAGSHHRLPTTWGE